ncbi:MAG: amylosucrase, partial [Anaerolineales bacterium]
MISPPDEAWLEEQARISLQRLLPRVKRRYSRQAADKAAWRAFVQRLEANFGNLFQTLFHLYGQQYDFFYHLEN